MKTEQYIVRFNGIPKDKQTTAIKKLKTIIANDSRYGGFIDLSYLMDIYKSNEVHFSNVKNALDFYESLDEYGYQWRKLEIVIEEDNNFEFYLPKYLMVVDPYNIQSDNQQCTFNSELDQSI